MKIYSGEIAYLDENDREDKDLDDSIALAFRIKNNKIKIVKDEHGILTKVKKRKYSTKGFINLGVGNWVFGYDNIFSGYIKGQYIDSKKILISGEYKGKYYDNLPVSINTVEKVIPLNVKSISEFRNSAEYFKIESIIKSAAVEKGFTKDTCLKKDGINAEFSGVPSGEIGSISRTHLTLSGRERNLVLDSANGFGYIYKNGRFANKIK